MAMHELKEKATKFLADNMCDSFDFKQFEQESDIDSIKM